LLAPIPAGFLASFALHRAVETKAIIDTTGAIVKKFFQRIHWFILEIKARRFLGGKAKENPLAKSLNFGLTNGLYRFCKVYCLWAINAEV